MRLSAHKAYNSAWYLTSSKNPLRPLMLETFQSVRSCNDVARLLCLTIQ